MEVGADGGPNVTLIHFDIVTSVVTLIFFDTVTSVTLIIISVRLRVIGVRVLSSRGIKYFFFINEGPQAREPVLIDSP